MNHPPGAQAERTHLSWIRTLIGLVAVAALGTNMALRMGSPVLAILAFAVPTMTGAALTHRRLARLSEAEPPAPRWYEPFLLGCASVASALIAIIVIVVG